MLAERYAVVTLHAFFENLRDVVNVFSFFLFFFLLKKDKFGQFLVPLIP